MKGRNLGPLRDSFAEQGRGSLLHLGGRFVRERDREDSLGRGALPNEFGDAMRHNARFPRARAGQDQERPREGADGFSLRRIEMIGHAPMLAFDGASGKCQGDNNRAILRSLRNPN